MGYTLDWMSESRDNSMIACLNNSLPVGRDDQKEDKVVIS